MLSLVRKKEFYIKKGVIVLDKNNLKYNLFLKNTEKKEAITAITFEGGKFRVLELTNHSDRYMYIGEYASVKKYLNLRTMEIETCNNVNAKRLSTQLNDVNAFLSIGNTFKLSEYTRKGYEVIINNLPAYLVIKAIEDDILERTDMRVKEAPIFNQMKKEEKEKMKKVLNYKNGLFISEHRVIKLEKIEYIDSLPISKTEIRLQLHMDSGKDLSFDMSYNQIKEFRDIYISFSSEVEEEKQIL